MHVIEHMHAIQPIQNTQQGEDKKKVQLVLNMYFGKFMRMITNTHLKMNTNTMHQCVATLVAPENTMCMLADDLDEGVKPMHWFQWRQEFALARCDQRCMHTITDDQAWHQITTFTITSMSKSWSHHNGSSVNDVFQGFLKPCCLT